MRQTVGGSLSPNFSIPQRIRSFGSIPFCFRIWIVTEKALRQTDETGEEPFSLYSGLLFRTYRIRRL